MTRYVPARALPALAYIPGKTARPAADPQGRHGRAAFVPASWRASQTYLFAFDLLAHGFPWEAHEAWESLWRTMERGSAEGQLLQGLIKLAASQVKARQGNTRGRRAHAASAAAVFRRLAATVAPERVLLGVDLEAAARSAEAVGEEPGSSPQIELVGAPRFEP